MEIDGNYWAEIGSLCMACGVGTLEINPSADCMCHVVSPCPECVEAPLICPECGLEIPVQ